MLPQASLLSVLQNLTHLERLLLYTTPKKNMYLFPLFFSLSCSCLSRFVSLINRDGYFEVGEGGYKPPTASASKMWLVADSGASSAASSVSPSPSSPTSSASSTSPLATADAVEFTEEGSTLCCGFVTQTHMVLANLGDSRAVLARDQMTWFSTHDHKPDDSEEKDRIQAAGSFVKDGRIDGDLALSRGIGDFRFKSCLAAPEEMAVSPAADLTTIKRHLDDQLLLIACDGVWDVITSDEGIQFVLDHLKSGVSSEEVCRRLLDHCLALGSTDNISAVLVLFNAAPTKVEGHAVHGIWKTRRWEAAALLPVALMKMDTNHALQAPGHGGEDGASASASSVRSASSSPSLPPTALEQDAKMRKARVSRGGTAGKATAMLLGAAGGSTPGATRDSRIAARVRALKAQSKKDLNTDPKTLPTSKSISRTVARRSRRGGHGATGVVKPKDTDETVATATSRHRSPNSTHLN